MKYGHYVQAQPEVIKESWKKAGERVRNKEIKNHVCLISICVNIYLIVNDYKIKYEGKKVS